MKKNKMMRLASVLLVLTLLSTSVISGTFAKYVTTDSQMDTARVAKFGVVASLSGDLFGKTYAEAKDNTIITYSENGGSVSTADVNDFVVAPGTQNDKGLTLSITGTPEVKTKVIFDNAEDSTGKDYGYSDIYLKSGKYGYMVPYTGELTKENIEKYYVKDGTKYRQAMDSELAEGLKVYELHGYVEVTEDYYPLTWKVVASGKTTDGIKHVEDVKQALADEFNGKGFAPNMDNKLNAVVTWVWNYGKAWGDISGTDEYTVKEDLMDTILGNMMAKHQDKDFVDVVKLNGTVYHAVEIVPENVGANKILVVKANSAKVACLTVAFNARLTVEQVD